VLQIETEKEPRLLDARERGHEESKPAALSNDGRRAKEKEGEGIANITPPTEKTGNKDTGQRKKGKNKLSRDFRAKGDRRGVVKDPSGERLPSRDSEEKEKKTRKNREPHAVKLSKRSMETSPEPPGDLPETKCPRNPGAVSSEAKKAPSEHLRRNKMGKKREQVLEGKWNSQETKARRQGVAVKDRAPKGKWKIQSYE